MARTHSAGELEQINKAYKYENLQLLVSGRNNNSECFSLPPEWFTVTAFHVCLWFFCNEIYISCILCWKIRRCFISNLVGCLCHLRKNSLLESEYHKQLFLLTNLKQIKVLHSREITSPTSKASFSFKIIPSPQSIHKQFEWFVLPHYVVLKKSKTTSLHYWMLTLCQALNCILCEHHITSCYIISVWKMKRLRQVGYLRPHSSNWLTEALKRGLLGPSPEVLATLLPQ